MAILNKTHESRYLTLDGFKRTAYMTDGNAGSTCWIRPSGDQFSTPYHFPKPTVEEYQAATNPDDENAPGINMDNSWKPALASGGFTFEVTFGLNVQENPTGARMFIGVQQDTNTPADKDPASMLNAIGIAQLDSSNNDLYFICNGNATNAAKLVGAQPFEASFKTDTACAYTLIIDANPEKTNVVNMSLKNLTTGHVFNHAFVGVVNDSDNLIPADTIPLRPILWRANSVNSTATGFDLVRMSGSSYKPYETNNYVVLDF